MTPVCHSLAVALPSTVCDDIVHLFYLQVIDNDKLTVANLNRIKTLEAQLNESARLVEALETENVELRRAIADENEVRLNAEYRLQIE